MRKLRDGDPVLVKWQRSAVEATVRGQGRDSGGPWVLVEYPGGKTEVVHPDRVSKKETT